MSVVIGVDQSYTGFAWTLEEPIKWDTNKKAFPLSKFNSAEQRLWTIRDWWMKVLTDIEQVYRVDLVVMEGYAFGAKAGREQAGELGGVVKLAILDVFGENKFIIVPPTTLKKFVTDRGNAKKNEMLLGVYKNWGVEFTDDNEADSYSLTQFGCAYLGATSTLRVPQKKALDDYKKAQIKA